MFKKLGCIDSEKSVPKTTTLAVTIALIGAWVLFQTEIRCPCSFNTIPQLINRDWLIGDEPVTRQPGPDVFYRTLVKGQEPRVATFQKCIVQCLKVTSMPNKRRSRRVSNSIPPDDGPAHDDDDNVRSPRCRKTWMRPS
ncbi:hypothetical protein TNCV_2048721 [Trichonephila clavipes]|nr:hypothetical protein TNCV_2048721 [Trichonephila clavipes]